MQNERIDLLASKFLDGSATEAEKAELHAWYDEWKDDELVVVTELPGNEEAVKERILSGILQAMKPDEQIPVAPVRSLRRYWKAAAAAVLLLIAGAGTYLAVKKDALPEQTIASDGLYRNDVAPGKDIATLQLADGSVINLADSIQPGLQQGNASLNKEEEGLLVYTAPSSLKNEAASVSYNTISTPNGGEFKIVLSDGSKVWLNAASSLRFPAAFTGKERNVELSGEAYFEIAHNASQPFTVTAAGTTTRVLGTHFNIKAYNDEEDVTTTLLEGSVRMETGQQQKNLTPGQQALIRNGAKKIDVSAADVDDAVAWKNGYFTFRNENIRDIMRRISRWYDVRVTYEAGVEASAFGGTFSRTKSLKQLLKSLEITNTIHFKIEGKNVTVMP
ncbi:FecR domain-containing protein [Terrimonas sp. NA20]|uniref:FecR domain-containing protein n=1 Tax=Terrimonas ginsenosidimutans TaxID=2908004 RepID=A0ABS9KMF9_9BACT|nr:FecR family protein [Terrimonas ginsenosidimutans]MCG2613520.1 FecR domain-containing protein [Terrimonas ginsenosidimutans]